MLSLNAAESCAWSRIFLMAGGSVMKARRHTPERKHRLAEVHEAAMKIDRGSKARAQQLG
jgi:hypothetical protein